MANEGSDSVSVIGNLPGTALQALPVVAGSNTLQLAVDAISSNEMQFTFNGIMYTQNTGSKTVYGTWNLYGFAQDNGTNIYYYGSNTITVSNTLTINPALSTPTLTASNTLIDAGQFSLLTPTISGGSPNYVENIIISNSVTKAPINSIQVTAASGTAELIYFPSWYMGNTLQVNVLVSDSATFNAIANSIYAPLGLNSILTGTPALSFSNSLTIDTGQWETLTASGWSAGTNPYTINFLVYNSVTNTVVFNDLLTGDIATSNTFTFQVNSNSGNTLYANVFVQDAATTNAVVNSILTSIITVNSVLATPAISPSSAQSNTTGQTVTFATYETGGSAPYTYNFIVYNSATNIAVANQLSSSNSFAYALPSGELGNTLYANVFITDSATPAVTVNSILSGAITVSAASSSSGGGAGIRGSGGTGVFTTSVPTTTAASTVPTTTTIPATTLSKTSFNSTINISSISPTYVNVSNFGIVLAVISTSSGTSSSKITIVNVTNSTMPAPSGFNKLLAVNITLISSANLSTIVTLKYPCSIQSSSIAPYMLKNGTWQPISIANFTLNSAACSVTFSITKDPIIGLFQNVASQTTAIATTTVPPSSQQTTTAQASPNSNGASALWIIAIMAVILIAAGAWFITRRKE